MNRYISSLWILDYLTIDCHELAQAHSSTPVILKITAYSNLGYSNKQSRFMPLILRSCLVQYIVLHCPSQKCSSLDIKLNDRSCIPHRVPHTQLPFHVKNPPQALFHLVSYLWWRKTCTPQETCLVHMLHPHTRRYRCCQSHQRQRADESALLPGLHTPRGGSFRSDYGSIDPLLASEASSASLCSAAKPHCLLLPSVEIILYF